MFITLYAAHKIVNKRLEESGLDRRIPPQMMYNYAKKNYLATVDGKIDTEVLDEWIEKFVEKKLSQSTTTETVEA